VTGIIHHVEKEPDDDEHIQLQLHLQFEDLLNDRNRTGRQGCLVLEPIVRIRSGIPIHSRRWIQAGHLGSAILDGYHRGGIITSHTSVSIIGRA